MWKDIFSFKSFMIMVFGFVGGVFAASTGFSMMTVGFGYMSGLLFGYVFACRICGFQSKGVLFIFQGVVLGALAGIGSGCVTALLWYVVNKPGRISPVGVGIFGGFIGAMPGIVLGLIFSLSMFISSRIKAGLIPEKSFYYIKIVLFICLVMGQLYWFNLAAVAYNARNANRGESDVKWQMEQK